MKLTLWIKNTKTTTYITFFCQYSTVYVLKCLCEMTMQIKLIKMKEPMSIYLHVYDKFARKLCAQKSLFILLHILRVQLCQPSGYIFLVNNNQKHKKYTPSAGQNQNVHNCFG